MTGQRVKSKPKVRVRIKLAIGAHTLGPGKAQLLKNIQATGSISAAAREMGIHYRRAWFLLDTLNEALGRPVVETTKGGARGGGAELTEAGRALLAAYEQAVETAEKATRPGLEKFGRMISDN